MFANEVVFKSVFVLCFSTKIVSRVGRVALETIFEVYCEDTLLFYGVAHSVRQRPYAAEDNARSNGCARRQNSVALTKSIAVPSNL